MMPGYLHTAAMWLQFEEGYRRAPYRCTAGKLTIGYGRNLDSVGISRQEAALMDAYALSIGHQNKSEEFYYHPVLKPNGYFIGNGHNLTRLGISKNIAEMLLFNDISTARRWLEKFHFWDDLSTVRKCALLNMGFQLGETRFKKFKNTIKHLENNLWTHAATECLDSRWAKQTPNRAQRVAYAIKEDKLPESVLQWIQMATI